jgi:hypothetical protein
MAPAGAATATRTAQPLPLPRAWPSPSHRRRRRRRAFAADPPPGYIDAAQGPLGANSSDQWCAPYGYKAREQGCGGADKWSVFPGEAFPGVGWDAGAALAC